MPHQRRRTDAEMLRAYAEQTNTALNALLKRIEALESRPAGGGTAPVVINISGGSSLQVETQPDERIGFRSKT
jgi:hypothetical protein